MTNVIKKRSTTSTDDSVTSDNDNLIVHLEQSDIDMRNLQATSAQFVRWVRVSIDWEIACRVSIHDFSKQKSA